MKALTVIFCLVSLQIFSQVHLPTQSSSPNNNVGINEAIPEARLHISDDSEMSSCQPAILIDGNNGNSTGGGLSGSDPGGDNPEGGDPEGDDPEPTTCSTPYAIRVYSNDGINRIMSYDLSAGGKMKIGSGIDNLSTNTTISALKDIGVYNSTDWLKLQTIDGTAGLNWKSPSDFQISYNNSLPLFELSQEGTLNITNITPLANQSAGSNYGIRINNTMDWGHSYAFEIFTSSSKKIFSISNSGHVHIGPNLNFDIPNSGNFRLYVEDGIRTERVRIDVSADNGWADYVFEEDYEMMSLEAVESFIKENGHLPGVPSEEEVLADGIDLAEMNKILLEKIEELTLRMIEMEKKLNEKG